MNKEMKIAILIGDGMADRPIESLGNRTPLEYADTPNMDALARKGICGLARTVPIGMQPGSDTANLSIFGYDPRESYSGRAPLEAINMGIDMGKGDAAFRCNIVSLEGGVMKDFSAGHIDSGYSRLILEELAPHLPYDFIELYPGVSYRNIMIWRRYPYLEITGSTPPHDIHGEEAAKHLPNGDGADILRKIMEISERVIRDSEKIRRGKESYRGEPTSAWLWGGGWKPKMKGLRERYGLHGYTISAVDLIHGIGRAAGLESIPVEGATGYIDTNYEGKAAALIKGLKKANIVFLHVESPDESGHEGNLEHKLKAIEDFDKRVVGPVMDGLQQYRDYAVLVMPDHPTPVAKRTHTPDPVPFCIYWSTGTGDPALAGRSAGGFSEKAAAESGLFIEDGHRLLRIMIRKKL